MPRKKLIRHFEPRYGVSHEMVDVEATYIAREHQDWMILSTTDLQQKLQGLRGKWQQANETAEMLLRSFPQRESLAFQCLVVRDLYLLLELYGSCLRTSREIGDPQPIIPAPAARPAELTKLPFSEWLFGPTK